jgi:beta-lactamase class A
MKQKPQVLILIISLSINLILTLILITKPTTPNEVTTPPFNFTRPQTTAFEDAATSSASILHYNGLKDQLITIIDEQASQSAKVSLYLQDITTGATLGINENQGFFPASLLKIPIMMAILKKVDNQEMALTDKITLIQLDFDAGSGDLYLKPVGTKFTINELLSHMIKSSDNTAKNALKRQLSTAELNAPFVHVGIPNPYLSTDQSVTPRNYTRLFKSLYHSTYLSSQLSEKALNFATDTLTENLLAAEIPSEIQVAHKYGSQEGRTLSDCGIIYDPSNPYLLCIMVNSPDNNLAASIIRTLSGNIYRFISTAK